MDNWINLGKEKRFLTLQCKKCNTIKSKTPSDWEKTKYKCFDCNILENIKILSSNDYTVVEYGGNIKTKCNKCDVLRLARFSQYVNDSFKCYNCENIKFHKNNNFKFLKIIKVNNTTMHSAMCLECNSIINKHISDWKKYPYCYTCKSNNEIKNIFINWVYLGKATITKDIIHHVAKCSKCNTERSDILSNWKTSNSICYTCNPISTVPEMLIKNILDKNNIEYIQNDYSILGDKELDFYIPKHNIAIEYNGLYWHSEAMGKHKKYHLEKTEVCEKKRINLLHIMEYDDFSIWESILLNKLQLTPNKIYARKCIVKEISIKEAQTFLEENHLGGYSGAKYKLGLFYNDELVQVATFGKNRYSQIVEWELIRLATKKFYNVVGGTSKIIKYFQNIESGGLLSYGDRRYSYSYRNVYSNTNFYYSHTSLPNYKYFKNGKIYPREEFQKHKLKDKLDIFDSNLTEYQNMLNNGYNRIWDCGNLVYIKNPRFRN